MLKLPTVVTREIDGFLPAADAVKRGLQARRGQAAPEAAGEHRRPRQRAEGPRLRALY